MSTENFSQIHSTDSLTPGHEGPPMPPSEATAVTQPQQQPFSPSLPDNQKAVESKLVLTVPLPKSTSPPEHQGALVRRSGRITQLTTKAKELLEY